MAPVTMASSATASAAATRAGTTSSSARALRPTAPPIAAPTSGKKTDPRATASPSRSTRRPMGTIVRKATAAAAARIVSGTRIRHTRVVERRHVGEKSQPRLDDGERERRPAALSQPEPEIEERAQPEICEHERMTGLGRPVRRDHGLRRERLQARGHERGCTGDEAVEEDRYGHGGGAETDAGQHRDLEAPERREHTDRIG